MEKLLFFALTLAVASATPAGRIVGGDVTSILKYPFAVSMMSSWTGTGEFTHNCGGTIINSRAVLTAAHCIQRPFHLPETWRIRAGSSKSTSGGTVFTVKDVIPHWAYMEFLLNHDIGIVRINGEFPFTATIGRATLANPKYALPDETPLTVIGWGQLGVHWPASEDLREAKIKVINQHVCRLVHLSQWYLLLDGMFCAGGDWEAVGPCSGDSGGAVLHNNVVVGIVSWGYWGCAHALFPTVHTEVSRFTKWIEDNA